MKKKAVNNPVSISITKSIRNQFGEYLPKIAPPMGGTYWAIGANLPKEHKIWIANIVGIQILRETVRQEIENVLSYHVFEGQSYLDIRWTPNGTAFKTDGVNGCVVFVDSSSIDYGYHCHNIDNDEQAIVLFVALSIYLPRLYTGLENFENGTFNPKKFPALEEDVTETISLRKKL